MNQQFRLRGENQEADRTRTGFLQSFKLRTAEKERQPVASSSNSIQGTMFQRNTELQSNEYEGENVSSLHARLHQEADKIRKWKIQTELDLKEKDKRLIASSAQMETMKKSMLELQLDNERLSSRMQEEIDNREELIGKITSTRDMCHLLKSTTAKLEDKWLHCETEKTELKYVGREHTQHLEELSNKFEQCHISIENNQKKLISQVEKERSENIEKEKLWTSKYEEKVALIDKLECELKERNGVVTEMSAALQETTCTLNKLKEAVARMEEDNKTLKTALEAKVEDFKESSLRILTIQDEKHELEARLGKFHVDLTCLQETKEKICLEMEASTAKYQQDMATAQGNIQEFQKGLEEEQQKLTSCQNELQDTLTKMETLKSSKDLLTLEFTELELKLDLQNYENVNLKSELSDKKEEIQNLTVEMDALTKNIDKESLCRIQLQDCEKVLQSKLSALELEKEELLQTCSDLKTSLTDKERKFRETARNLQPTPRRII